MKNFLLLAILTFAVNAFSNQKAKYEIKWILAHEPARVFEKAAQEFAQRIEKKSNGEIAVQIIHTGTDSKYKGTNVKTAFDLVQSGELQMSQTYSTFLGNYHKDMWILDLPFLFKSHEHASKVLDGTIGKQILAGLEKSNIHGLAFTYSGGFRIIPTQNKPLDSIAAFAGQKIGVAADSPVAQAYLRQLKAVPVMVNDVVVSGSDSSDGFETTYARLNNVNAVKMKYLNETEHTLFLTSILINKEFYNKLPSKLQKLVNETAIEVANLERAESIKDNLNSRKDFVEKQKMQVVTMDASEAKKMKEAADPVYKAFSKVLDQKIVKQIQASAK